MLDDHILTTAPLTPAVRGLMAQRITLARMAERLTYERDMLISLVGRLHDNAAESPEWIRARIDETLSELIKTQVRN